MYCKNCGKEISDNAYVCPNCGVKVATETAPRQKNNKALIGFIFSFFIPLVGLILGILGYRDSQEMNDEGRGLAIAAIVISAVALVINIIVSIVYISALSAVMQLL